MEERAVSSIIVVLTVVVVIELVAVAVIGVYYLRSGKSSTGGFADMDVSISPGSQSGATGAKLTYIVTVTNIGDVSDTYSLGVDWGNLSYKISPSILSINAGDSENATLIVTVGTVSEVMEVYVTNGTVTFGGTFTTNVTGKELYALTTIVNGEGSVALNPAGEQYGPTIPRLRGVSTVGYLSGTVVTATATPASGYEFDNWSGDASGTATSVTVTMNSDKKITANFRQENKIAFTVTVVDMAPLIAPENYENKAWLPNPAGVYAHVQGYELQIRTDNAGNQYGVVIFPDGEECGEWDFFNGKSCAQYRKFPPEFLIYTGKEYYEKKSGTPNAVGVYRYLQDNLVPYRYQYEMVENLVLEEENWGTGVFTYAARVEMENMDNLCVGYPYGLAPDNVIVKKVSNGDEIYLYNATYVGPSPHPKDLVVLSLGVFVY